MLVGIVTVASCGSDDDHDFDIGDDGGAAGSESSEGGSGGGGGEATGGAGTAGEAGAPSGGGGTSGNAGTPSGGGVAVLTALVGSDKTGIANVTAATGRDFDDAFVDWLAAVALDGTGATTDKRYNFATPTTDPQTDAPHGMDLRGTRNNSEGVEVTLEGPTIEDFDTAEVDGEVVAGGAMHYLYLAPAGETVTVSISGAASASLGFLVFVR